MVSSADRVAARQTDSAGEGSSGSPAPSQPRVVAEHVGIDYYIRRSGTHFTAVKDVSFTINDGDLVCVVGPSGCGKSTLASALAGLTPYDRGSLSIGGTPVKGVSSDRAMVFQKAALLPWKTVVDNVAYGLRLRSETKASARAKSRDMLEVVGLAGFQDSWPYELSGGMQQRVNLARALAVDPEILLLDEPFASVDAQTRAILQNQLLEIWQNFNKTGLFITHQIEEAVLLGDRVIVMSKGPGSVVLADITIDLPRPRTGSIHSNPKFASYVDQIWGQLNFDRL